MAAGADKMIYNLRSLASARPDHCFIATDIKNNFAAFLRHKALHALITHTPLLAPIMSLFWKQPHTELLIPREQDKMTELHKEFFRVNACTQHLLHFPPNRH